MKKKVTKFYMAAVLVGYQSSLLVVLPNSSGFWSQDLFGEAQ